MNRIRHQTGLVRRLALGFAIAAIGVPGEIASARPPSTPIASEQERHATASTAQLPSLEELQQFRFTPGDATVATLPPLSELDMFRFQPVPVETPAVAPPADGIDWGDAGIGAGIGVAAVGLAAAAAFGVRRHQRLAHS
jgi:hypothetical protein